MSEELQDPEELVAEAIELLKRAEDAWRAKNQVYAAAGIYQWRRHLEKYSK